MEASVFMKDLPWKCDGAGGMRRDRGGFYCPARKVRINPYLGVGYSFLPVSPEPPGVKQASKHPRVEDGNMGTVRVCLFGRAGYPWRPGKGTYGAESL